MYTFSLFSVHSSMDEKQKSNLKLEEANFFPIFDPHTPWHHVMEVLAGAELSAGYQPSSPSFSSCFRITHKALKSSWNHYLL